MLFFPYSWWCLCLIAVGRLPDCIMGRQLVVSGIGQRWQWQVYIMKPKNIKHKFGVWTHFCSKRVLWSLPPITDIEGAFRRDHLLMSMGEWLHKAKCPYGQLIIVLNRLEKLCTSPVTYSDSTNCGKQWRKTCF